MWFVCVVSVCDSLCDPIIVSLWVRCCVCMRMRVLCGCDGVELRVVCMCVLLVVLEWGVAIRAHSCLNHRVLTPMHMFGGCAYTCITQIDHDRSWCCVMIVCLVCLLFGL